MEKSSLETTKKEYASNLSVSSEGVIKPLGESMLDFLGVIITWRRFIAWFVLSCTVVTTVFVLFLPKWYKSTASVFGAEQADLFSGLDGGVGSLVKSFSSTKKLSSLGGPTELDRYVAILSSNTVRDSVIRKANLLEVYDLISSPYRVEKSRKELASNTEIEIQDEGNLTISAYDKDPQRSADIANYYVQLLNEINSELRVQNARGNRLFIEQRYQKNSDDIRAAEEALKAFQLKYGVIAMPEQTEASIKAAAEVSARLATKEIELGVLKRTLSADHPGIQSAEIEIDEIKRKIREFNTGSRTSSQEMNILVPFRQTPDLGMQYIRLFREVEIQYKILQFITPLYEQAKVEEQRSTPSVVVLDHAVAAERKAKPKVALYALLSFVISTAVALFIVFLIVGIQRLRAIDPDRFNSLSNALRSDWFGLKRLPWKNSEGS